MTTVAALAEAVQRTEAVAERIDGGYVLEHAAALREAVGVVLDAVSTTWVVEFGVDQDGRREFVVEVGSFMSKEVATSVALLGIGRTTGDMLALPFADATGAGEDHEVIVGASVVAYHVVDGTDENSREDVA